MTTGNGGAPARRAFFHPTEAERGTLLERVSLAGTSQTFEVEGFFHLGRSNLPKKPRWHWTCYSTDVAKLNNVRTGETLLRNLQYLCWSANWQIVED